MNTPGAGIAIEMRGAPPSSGASEEVVTPTCSDNYGNTAGCVVYNRIISIYSAGMVPRLSDVGRFLKTRCCGYGTTEDDVVALVNVESSTVPSDLQDDSDEVPPAFSTSKLCIGSGYDNAAARTTQEP